MGTGGLLESEEEEEKGSTEERLATAGCRGVIPRKWPLPSSLRPRPVRKGRPQMDQ